MSGPISTPKPIVPAILASALSAATKSAGDASLTSAAGAHGFGELLKDTAQKSIKTLRHNEKTAMISATGTSDLLLTMTAADNADITLQTMMVIRDRTLSAYQEISRIAI